MARSTDDSGSLFGEEAPRRVTELPEKPSAHQPLAARMRPRTMAEIAGQAHILKPGNLLPRLIASNRFGSLMFYGPPGCGKTSLAEVIARETKSRFVRVNAVMSNVAELREILAYARRMLRLPDWSIAARWHGVYAKGPDPIHFAAEPQPGCFVMGSPGGAGRTLAFGLAER